MRIIAAAPIAAALGLAAATTPALAGDYDDYAVVRRATPQYEQVNVPRQECYTEYIRDNRGSGERSYGGSILGGITGAIVGNQVGQGHGKEAATALGAITGAIVGDRLQNDGRRYADDDGRQVQRCRDVDHWERQLTGYQVVYEYGGRRYTTIMPNDPGDRLRIRVSVTPY